MDALESGKEALRYEARIASEIDIYRHCTEVHRLPPIFHYWSNRHIRPLFESHGFADPAEMFAQAVEGQCTMHQCTIRRNATVRVLSVGSGNCEAEVAVAVALRAKGYSDFTIECLDLNDAMLNRGAEHANHRGVAGNLEFVEADLNRWVAQREYHAVIADQSLHHVMELESLFGQIRQSLHPDGVFAISDMIGRNGHLRWPAALEIVREFWQRLPPSYRYNCRSERYEAFFEDADCSFEGFEGIRAQDIVRLLGEYFDFRFFLGFGNVIDPFVDRSFGPNFDPGAAWDREFIDQVHRRDAEEIAAGRLPPTHMLATLGKKAGAGRPRGVSAPVPVVRRECYVVSGEPPKSGYDWGSWPHAAQSQLESACRMIENSENRLKIMASDFERAVSWARQQEAEFQERTGWALQLDRQLEERTAWASQLDRQLQERTAWALQLDRQLQERTAWALQLDRQLEEHTAWVLRLDRQLEERTAWALRLDVQTQAAMLTIRERDEALREAEAELFRRAVWARKLESELTERTVWALRLDDELADRTRWAQRLDHDNAALLREIERLEGGFFGFLRRGLKIASRLLGGRAGSGQELPD